MSRAMSKPGVRRPKSLRNRRDIILRRVAVDDSTGCWIWIGAKSGTGYGSLRFDNKGWSAHRFSYEAFHDVSLSRTDVVMHMCDVPLCVNPDHLAVGTHCDNMRDCISKRRHAHKIKDDGIAYMRDAVARGESPTLIARTLGVSVRTVWDFKYRKWVERT